MNIESAREYCLSLAEASEDTAFGEDILLFRIKNKIFACIMLDRPDLITVKCDADYAIILREQHAEVEPAWHWNKKYWNQLSLTGELKDELIQALIRHSYSEVVKKLPKKSQATLPDYSMEPREV